jgi:hypothetical protein
MMKKRRFTYGAKKNTTSPAGSPVARRRRIVKTTPTHMNGRESTSIERRNVRSVGASEFIRAA